MNIPKVLKMVLKVTILIQTIIIVLHLIDITTEYDLLQEYTLLQILIPTLSLIILAAIWLFYKLIRAFWYSTIESGRKYNIQMGRRQVVQLREKLRQVGEIEGFVIKKEIILIEAKIRAETLRRCRKKKK